MMDQKVIQNDFSKIFDKFDFNYMHAIVSIDNWIRRKIAHWFYHEPKNGNLTFISIVKSLNCNVDFWKLKLQGGIGL